MRGDILFYHATDAVIDKLIVRATGPGDFIHTAIEWDGDSILEATNRGIDFGALPDPKRAERWNVANSARTVDLDGALAWAGSQRGDPYGWLDIVDQCLRLVGSPFYVGRLHSLDCSDLCACYAALALNDKTLLKMVIDWRQEISPNDLARYAGLLRSKGVTNG